MKAATGILLAIVLMLATVAAYAPDGTTYLTPGKTQVIYCAGGTLVVTLQRSDEIRLACK